MSKDYAYRHGTRFCEPEALIALTKKVKKAYGERASKTLLYAPDHPFWNGMGELDKLQVRDGKASKYLFEFVTRTANSACLYKWKDPKLISSFRYLETNGVSASPADLKRSSDWQKFVGDTYLVGNTKTAFQFLRAAQRAGAFIDKLFEKVQSGLYCYPLGVSRGTILGLARALRPDQASSRDFKSLAYKIRFLLKIA